MRENRPYGSEGGVGHKPIPTPISTPGANRFAAASPVPYGDAGITGSRVGASAPPGMTMHQNPGAFSTWSNQSNPMSLTIRLEITISRASSVAKCWWLVNGGM